MSSLRWRAYGKAGIGNPEPGFRIPESIFPDFSYTPDLRWPTTVTPNAHSKLQIAHNKFKSLTSNSNRSQQIQIAYSKFKSLTTNYKSLTANYKSLTANPNRPQQIQIVHSKLKSLTANSNCSQQITNY